MSIELLCYDYLLDFENNGLFKQLVAWSAQNAVRMSESNGLNYTAVNIDPT